MEAIYELSFKEEINCESCMLSYTAMAHDGETKLKCAALGNRPFYPNEGKHKDCPLK